MRWLNWFHLDRRDQVLLIQTFLWLGLVRFGLRFRSLPTLQRWLIRFGNAKANPTQTKISVDRIIWAVTASSLYMPGGGKCLAQALTAQIIMLRNGYDSQLQVGITKDEAGQLLAHAWIEHQGQVVIGNLPDLSNYQTFPGWKEKWQSTLSI